MNRDVVRGQGLFVIGGVGQGCGLWPGMVCDRGCWSGVWLVARSVVCDQECGLWPGV